MQLSAISKQIFLLYFCTFYDHKSGSSSFNNGAYGLNQNLGNFRQSGHCLSNFYFCEKLSF